ncbi:MAG: ComF family protein [Gammaproteobacteria bacterium]
MGLPTRLAHLLLPSCACLICEQPCTAHTGLCNWCIQELPYLADHCRQCGEAHAVQSLFKGRCGRCLAKPPQFDECVPVFHYASPVDRLITAFKYRSRFAAGSALAHLMAEHMRQLSHTRPLPQLLLPVPLHWRRLQQRGFNQSWLLCQLLSRQLDLPADVSTVIKQRHTEPQSELSGSARRRRNLRGAFALRPGHGLSDVKHIAIIDDVVTTMSTAEELARMLRGHGIRRIELWCLARARR